MNPIGLKIIFWLLVLGLFLVVPVVLFFRTSERVSRVVNKCK